MSETLTLSATLAMSAADESRLTAIGRQQIRARLRLLEPVLALQRGHCVALADLARKTGISQPTLYRWWQKVKEGRVADLADKRHDSAQWSCRKREGNTVLLPAADIQRYREYCVRYQRDGGNKAAWRKLVRDWAAGTITTTQPLDPMRQHPVGWSYTNLLRKAPDKYVLSSARHGRSAAYKHRAQVLTTRVGLRCGQYYVGDDVWHDHVVHYPGQRTPVRPVEGSVLDLASADLVKWGLRPRRLRENGTHEYLSEREVRWIVAATLRDCGYRTDELGTTWLVEKGTFAIRGPLAALLYDHFGIRVETSGIMKQAAWCGAYGGAGGGNPRFKTALESLHSLRHTEMACLPGQVGRNRDAVPDEHAALVKYAEAIEDLRRQLARSAPDLAEKLCNPTGLWFDFVDAADRIYAIINSRRDHRLEGWSECGHEVVQYLVGQQLLDEEQFLALPAPTGTDITAWGRSLAVAGHTKTRLRSPAEVWARGRRELTPLPTQGVALILGDELAREQKVEAGEFVWADADLGPGEWRYFAEITTPEGRRETLRNGETYQVFPNPFLRDELCVADAKGRYLGVARRHDRACRADAEAMKEQFKAVAHAEADHLAELNRAMAPVAADRLTLRQHNAAVKAAAADRAKRLGFGTKAAAATQAELLAKRSGRAAQAPKHALPNGDSAKDDGSWL